MRKFQVGKCETKFGIIFRVRPYSKNASMQFEILDGFMESIDEEHAAKIVKTILKNALTIIGIGLRTYPTCPQCKQMIYEGWKFCPSCGREYSS